VTASLAQIVGAQVVHIAHDPVDHRLHIRTVIANEHHERAVRPAQVVETVSFAVDARQAEGGRLPAEVADWCGFSHAFRPRRNVRDGTDRLPARYD
jgi:hypothetical protein